MMTETEDPDFMSSKIAPPPDITAHENNLFSSPKKETSSPTFHDTEPPDPAEFGPPEVSRMPLFGNDGPPEISRSPDLNGVNGFNANLNVSNEDEDKSAADLNDSYSDIGTHTDLNSSVDHPAREDELNDSNDIPEINKSTLSFNDEREIPEEPKKTWSGSTHTVEAGSAVQAGMTRAIEAGVAKLNPKPIAPSGPVDIKPVPIGDQKLRSKLRFDVVTAKVKEENGKKHVAYSIMMKRAGGDSNPAVIERRYNDFCSLYERILCTFHPSILGDFQFPKKVLIGNFKAEVITERTDAFHKFLNLIGVCDKLLYSDYFHAFLCSDEQNEAVSYIKLGRYSDAAPLLETIFYVREKLVTISHVSVLEVLIELVACFAEIEAEENAYRYSLVAAQCLHLLHGHPEANRIKIPFLHLASRLAVNLGHDPRPYNKQLSELRYAGVKTDKAQAQTLLEVIREKYIHTATRTARTW